MSLCKDLAEKLRTGLKRKAGMRKEMNGIGKRITAVRLAGNYLGMMIRSDYENKGQTICA